MEKSDNCDICTGIEDTRYMIFESDYWRVFPHLDVTTDGSDQQYLGRAVVLFKHHAPNLPSLSQFPEAAFDFLQVAGKYEQAVSRAFGADMYNWMAMMNYGWPNTHLHWHAFPRYSKSVQFAGIEFTDENFGKFISREKRIVSAEVKKLIVEEIKKNL